MFKKEKPMLWISFGTLERRKLSDIDEVTSLAYHSVQRVEITHDSYAVILMPNARVLQHIPVGYHLRISYLDKGLIFRFLLLLSYEFLLISVPDQIEVTRSFTPVPITFLPPSCSVTPTCVPLLIKRYETGTLSKYLTSVDPLAIGLQISQPKGTFSLYKIRMHTKVAMLAAGSGLTPMLSILNYLLARTNNKMCVNLR